tara:strand:+ start:92 stop:544 length:453 start_codon:yes stop_codon:yes gene_type:complete
MYNMVFYFKISLIVFSFLYPQKNLPSNFWKSYSQDQKIAFINGAYGTISKLKSHHKSEVRKQYMHDKNWIEPYYIERFYEIADEYLANSVGYDLVIIASHIDAFYSNSDNYNIPILEALRIVSLVQDGEQKKANIRLLRAQQKNNNFQLK